MHTCNDDTQNILKTFTKETTRKNNIKSKKGITEKDIYKLFDNEKKGTEKEYIGQETNRSDMNLSFEEFLLAVGEERFVELLSKKDFKTIDYLIGVAYNSNNQMIISYAKGRANINLFHSYCLIKEKKRMRNENCMWDEDCMKDCNDFKRKYKNY